MAAQISFVLAIFGPYFNEPGADPQSHPKPLKLKPIATEAYAENGLRLSHWCYPAYFQQFNRQKGPVFAAKIVTAVQLARVRVPEPCRRQVTDRCNGYIGRRRLGRRFRAKPEYPLESDANLLSVSKGLNFGSRTVRRHGGGTLAPSKPRIAETGARLWGEIHGRRRSWWKTGFGPRAGGCSSRTAARRRR